MHKLLFSSLALALATTLGGCQSLSIITHSQDDAEAVAPQIAPPESEVGVSVKAPAEKAPEYEKVPDLSNAEQLVAPVHHSPELIGSNELINMYTQPDMVRQNAALSENLPAAQENSAVMVGAADPYSSVQEGQVATNLNQQPLFEVAPAPRPAEPNRPAPHSEVSNELQLYQQSSGGCSLSLHAEASGVARTLGYETAHRLKDEQGQIFIAPTIVTQEYNECINDLSTAIRDGLATVPQFQVVEANQNLENVISQNIGSSAILPGLIHQCRATGIPYLAISQIRKVGDKAALTLRIIRTEDGITLQQNFRRLSE